MQAESQPTDRSDPPRRSAVATALLVIAAIVVLGLVGWAIVALVAGGPVPAAEAQIEISFLGDGTSFVGDSEIEAGTATVTFTNDTDGEGMFFVMRYETGSEALAEELAAIGEGGTVVTSNAPVTGYVEALSDWPVMPGTHTYELDLQAGNTYLFDAGYEDFKITGIWRMAVIEVVEP